jgi:hypothetical protein
MLLIMGDQDYFYDFSNPMDPSQKGMPKTDSPLFRITGLDRVLGLRHDQTINRLEAKGIPVQQMIIPGMAHTISAETVKAIADFISTKISAAKESSGSDVESRDVLPYMSPPEGKMHPGGMHP